MNLWKGEGIAGKVFVSLIATFCVWLLSSFVNNSINGNRAYDQIQIISPKIDTLCHRVTRLENEPKKWQDAAEHILKINTEEYNRRTYKDSIRWEYFIKKSEK